MGLEEKIHRRIKYHTGLYKSNLTKEISEIADDYAIEFGNWLNNHVINTDGRHHNLCFNSKVSQLFPIFKKEKEL